MQHYFFLSCPSDISATHQQDQLQLLQAKLLKARIPDCITSAIIHGITHWSVRQSDTSKRQRSPTAGILNPLSTAITQAYSDQTNLIGWDNMAGLAFYGRKPF